MDVSAEILDIPVSEARFCAVDVETSGLNMASRLVEVGAVRFSLDGEYQEFQSLLNPCERIWRDATDIHGITDEMVRNAPRAPDVLPGLLNFIRDSVFIAHNATFDVRMISNELARFRTELPPNPVVCTIALSRKHIMGPENYRLETLIDFLRIDAGHLHNALPDAHAARHVFLEGIRNLPADTQVRDLPGLIGRFGEVAPPSIEDFEPTGDIDELSTLVRSRLTIEMEYETPLSREPIVVTPVHLFDRNENRYMMAYCHRDGITKTYRLDRIVTFRRV